ncbi:hypothetical protein MTP99_004022 [Tenebrio molitor]|nr:hypothetical protein MTP99_004022 [Tenebrio molitor]
MAAFAARKFLLFSKATSRIQFSSSFSSQRVSRIFLFTVSPSPSHTTSWRHQPGRARPGRKRASTPEELRRRHKFLSETRTVFLEPHSRSH